MAQSLFNGPHVAGDTSLSFVGKDISQMSIQATVTGTGAVAAVVVLEGSHTAVDWIPVAQLNLSGTTRATDGGIAQTNWEFFRARIVSISADSALNCVVLSKGFPYGS